jgi:hypothetical protein
VNALARWLPALVLAAALMPAASRAQVGAPAVPSVPEMPGQSPAPDPADSSATSSSASFDTADRAFEDGVALTRAGRFEDALPRFLAAATAGDQSGRLYFNLGVVNYRLRRLGEARAAFERAARVPETADLSIYNLGLVALAGGEREEAARQFRVTLDRAESPELRALAERALARASGDSPRSGQGSLVIVRAQDSNVAIPLGTRGDVPSDREDGFWEARGGWSGALDPDARRIGYRVFGLATMHDRIDAADLGYVEGAVDWRGPFKAELGGSLLTVGDRAYQRTTDLRLEHIAHEGPRLRVSFEGAGSAIAALQASTRGLQGSRLYYGAQFELPTAPWSGAVILRRIVNDRRDADLSPDQGMGMLRLRYRAARWSSRAWVRYTRGTYPTRRRDETVEYGADLGLRLFGPLDLLVEATRLDQRSSAIGLDYESSRLYGGLRLRF